MNIMAGLGVAVREFPLKTGFADYLLYIDGKVAGLVEAKPEGHTLSEVEIQSSNYTLGLPDAVPHYRKPLPFAYESTGAVTQFTNSPEPDFRSREVFTFRGEFKIIRHRRACGDCQDPHASGLAGARAAALAGAAAVSLPGSLVLEVATVLQGA